MVSTNKTNMNNSNYLLVIDGDRELHQQLHPAMQQLSLTTEVAMSEQEAVHKIRTTPPRLILVSAELPEGNGYLVCKRLKKDQNNGSIPLILYSASASAEADFKKHRKLQHRADAYLKKPFHMLDLLDTMSELIAFPKPSPSRPKANKKDEAKVLDLEKQLAKEQKRCQKIDAELQTSHEKLAQLQQKNKEQHNNQQKLKAQIQSLQQVQKEEAAQSQQWAKKEKALATKHKKAQETLREYYKDKIKKLQVEAKAGEKLQEEMETMRQTILSLRQEVEAAVQENQKAKQDLEKERAFRKKLSSVLEES